MMTSGLVVMLASAEPARAETVAAIRRVPVFTVGDPSTDCLPVALEAKGPEASETWCAWLRDLPGVQAVEIVFVQWDEVEEVVHDGA